MKAGWAASQQRAGFWLNNGASQGRCIQVGYSTAQTSALARMVAETCWQAQMYYLQYDFWYGQVLIPPYIGDFLNVWVKHFVPGGPAFHYHPTKF